MPKNKLSALDICAWMDIINDIHPSKADNMFKKLKWWQYAAINIFGIKSSKRCPWCHRRLRQFVNFSYFLNGDKGPTQLVRIDCPKNHILINYTDGEKKSIRYELKPYAIWDYLYETPRKLQVFYHSTKSLHIKCINFPYFNVEQFTKEQVINKIKTYLVFS